MAEVHAQNSIPMRVQTDQSNIRTRVQTQSAGISMTVSENDVRVQPVIVADDIPIIPVHAQSNAVEIGTHALAAVYVGGDADPYIGSYTVKPDFEQQVLHTKHKTMSDDVKVLAIEVSHVSNTSGGNTVFIGGVFDG